MNWSAWWKKPETTRAFVAIMGTGCILAPIGITLNLALIVLLAALLVLVGSVGVGYASFVKALL
ncbi:MAG: hypothetical protein SF123_07590 [Chloroflexota bacterium]|nr:hypothetical protein [Chloroflexota bacterium]